MKRIESRNNPTVKYAVSLRDSKNRSSEKSFCFEGVHLLEEMVRSGSRPRTVFVREDVTARYSELIASAECEVIEVTDSVYSKLTEERAPQGIFTVSDFLDNVIFVERDIPLHSLSKQIEGNAILLSDLRDTGNVGTVIRTSAALGCDVLLCGSCADIYSQKTVRATMGAIFTNRVYICPSTVDTVSALRESGRRVIATALRNDARVLGEFELTDSDCFVIGNEGQGLRDSEIDSCDFSAIIPMSGRTESLNAASAASIILWESRRGRI